MTLNENFQWARAESDRLSSLVPVPENYKSRKEYLEAKILWKLENGSGLNIPVESDSLTNLLKEVSPYELPRELSDLYSWANGEKASGFIKPGYKYMSIKEGLETRGAYLDLIEAGEIPGKFSGFFPLMSNDNKVDVGIFLDDDDGYVYGFDVWAGEYYLLARSLVAYVGCMLECKRRGVYVKNRMRTTDPSDYLREEKSIFEELLGDVYPMRKVSGVTKFKIHFE